MTSMRDCISWISTMRVCVCVYFDAIGIRALVRRCKHNRQYSPTRRNAAMLNAEQCADKLLQHVHPARRRRRLKIMPPAKQVSQLLFCPPAVGSRATSAQHWHNIAPWVYAPHVCTHARTRIYANIPPNILRVLYDRMRRGLTHSTHTHSCANGLR